MRAGKSTQADKSVMFEVRKRPGYDSTVCSFTTDAQGINITVSGNANNIDWNAEGSGSAITAEEGLILVEAATDSGSSVYPIEARLVDSKRDDSFDDDLQIVDSTAITMREGVWYPVYWDTSNCLHSTISFDGASRYRLLSMAGGFTGTGTSTATTLAVYSDTTQLYSEQLSTAALSNTKLSSTFLSEGIVSEVGKRMIVRVSRATNLTVATWSVALGDIQDSVSF